MVDEDGYEYGLEVTRSRDGEERVEYHRHYSQAAARVALREERDRIRRGVNRFRGGTVVSVQLARRPVGEWEGIGDGLD